jgi:hypothetical protein
LVFHYNIKRFIGTKRSAVVGDCLAAKPSAQPAPPLQGTPTGGDYLSPLLQEFSVYHFQLLTHVFVLFGLRKIKQAGSLLI